MKRQIRILIIDDADQSRTVKYLQAQLKSTCDLECITIKTTLLELRKEGSEHLDTDKLRSKIKDELYNKKINWAFTDFNLAETDVNGLTVVDMLHTFRPNMQIVMYSGNQNAVIRSILGKSPRDAQDEEIISGIRKLLEYSIIDYVKRDDYADKVIELVNRMEEPTVQDYFLEQLRMYPDMEFKSCYPPLAGKTFGEIADMIEQHSDKRTADWTKELVEQTIAYLVKIND